MAVGFGNGLWGKVEELEHRVRVLEMEVSRFRALEELIKKFGLCHPDVQVARVDLPLEPFLPPSQPTTSQQPNRKDQEMK